MKLKKYDKTIIRDLTYHKAKASMLNIWPSSPCCSVQHSSWYSCPEHAAAGVPPSATETCSWKWQAGTNTSCSWAGTVSSPLWSFCTIKFKSKSILKRKQQASVLDYFCRTRIYYCLSQCMRIVYARILTHGLRSLAAAIQQLRAQVWWWLKRNPTETHHPTGRPMQTASALSQPGHVNEVETRAHQVPYVPPLFVCLATPSRNLLQCLQWKAKKSTCQQARFASPVHKAWRSKHRHWTQICFMSRKLQ